MKSDVPSGAPAPPPAAPPSSSASFANVRDRSVAELEGDIVAALRAAQPACPLDQPGPDGTPAIPSLQAVWVLSQVGAAVGTAKLVSLSRVDKEELRTIRGVARLVHRTIHAPAGAVAS